MSRLKLSAFAPDTAVVEVTLALAASAAGALVYHEFFATPAQGTVALVSLGDIIASGDRHCLMEFRRIETI